MRLHDVATIRTSGWETSPAIKFYKVTTQFATTFIRSRAQEKVPNKFTAPAMPQFNYPRNLGSLEKSLVQ